MLAKFLTILIEVIGIVFIIHGYRLNKRNSMLIGAMILWLGAALFDFIRGAIDGARGIFAA